ncbi:Alpha/Beta hydrolase protein [Halteromyces radiatus]|uniref:Alpha/Beta hydrolase protein n=1 Tax=Halteromyces radiatus TaxID=101107 RepID=UPI002220654F|nr:Alpha/Beta hydrolase protein [Halteromyces radiatus]KAI8096581.1 Alpha/Beta hydrolase protein [Halteromyces radiatus]
MTIVVKASSNTFLAITLTTALAVALYVCPRRKRLTAQFTQTRQMKFEQELVDEEESPLLTNNSDYVDVNGHELRIIEIINKNEKAPLMVFIHGLGGQASQWEHQLEHFSKSYHVVAIDSVGCGYSEVVKEWSCYTTTSLADDIIQLITSVRYPNTKPIILVGHSYGCAIATLVASSSDIKGRLAGMVLISPKAELGQDQAKGQKILPWIPDFIIENARNKDRQGGLYSTSVERLLGNKASENLRKRQLRWNVMSRTDVYKRTAAGATFPSSDIYGKLASVKILFIGGEKDEITPPSDMTLIRKQILESTDDNSDNIKQPMIIPNVGHMSLVMKPDIVNKWIDDFLLDI